MKCVIVMMQNIVYLCVPLLKPLQANRFPYRYAEKPKMFFAMFNIDEILTYYFSVIFELIVAACRHRHHFNRFAYKISV